MRGLRQLHVLLQVQILKDLNFIYEGNTDSICVVLLPIPLWSFSTQTNLEFRMPNWIKKGIEIGIFLNVLVGASLKNSVIDQNK